MNAEKSPPAEFTWRIERLDFANPDLIDSTTFDIIESEIRHIGDALNRDVLSREGRTRARARIASRR